MLNDPGGWQGCLYSLGGRLSVMNPTDGGNYDYYHFHIEFYPPYWTSEKLKYLAGSEAGAGGFINDTLAEEKAAELREVEPR